MQDGMGTTDGSSADGGATVDPEGGAERVGEPRAGAAEPGAEGVDATGGPRTAGADAKAPGDDPKGADDAAPGAGEDGPDRPRFRPQGEKEEEEPARPRTDGFTREIRTPSHGFGEEIACQVVSGSMDDLLVGGFERSAFSGSQLKVKLGVGSVYIFDGDRIPKHLREGGFAPSKPVSSTGEIRPSDVLSSKLVVGRVGDADTDPAKVKAANALRTANVRRNGEALAIQARAVLAAREAGSTVATPPCREVEDRFRGVQALIVGERMDALVDDDLKAFAERRFADVSVAGCLMMKAGVETPEPAVAREGERAAEAFDGHPSTGPAAAAAPEAEAQAEAGTAPAPTPGANAVVPTVIVAGPPTTMREQAVQAANDGFEETRGRGPAEAANDGAVLLAAAARDAGGRE